MNHVMRRTIPPLTEQKKTVLALATMDRLLELDAKRGELLKRLKRALMQERIR